MACEGPSGSEGPQGPEGPEGLVGPAGEDGSMMYSGQGAPSTDIGTEGDYYLKTNNGEMYGPKDGSGWGNPIMVLMGDDGQDGEDGSQIHAGSGAPDASLGDMGDFYLDQANYDMYGPKTDQGWGTPINLKGADGNANVTRYIFPGHDFSSSSSLSPRIGGITNNEFRESAWLVYLSNDLNVSNSTFRYYSVPTNGINMGSSYSVSFGNVNDQYAFFYFTSSGSPKDEYERIEIVRIEASNTEDQTKRAGDVIIKFDELNTANYQEIAEHYGFYR
jgi:hypothetical protein